MRESRSASGRNASSQHENATTKKEPNTGFNVTPGYFDDIDVHKASPRRGVPTAPAYAIRRVEVAPLGSHDTSMGKGFPAGLPSKHVPTGNAAKEPSSPGLNQKASDMDIDWEVPIKNSKVGSHTSSQPSMQKPSSLQFELPIMKAIDAGKVTEDENTLATEAAEPDNQRHKLGANIQVDHDGGSSVMLTRESNKASLPGSSFGTQAIDAAMWFLSVPLSLRLSTRKPQIYADEKVLWRVESDGFTTEGCFVSKDKTQLVIVSVEKLLPDFRVGQCVLLSCCRSNGLSRAVLMEIRMSVSGRLVIFLATAASMVSAQSVTIVEAIGLNTDTVKVVGGVASIALAAEVLYKKFNKSPWEALLEENHLERFYKELSDKGWDSITRVEKGVLRGKLTEDDLKEMGFGKGHLVGWDELLESLDIVINNMGDYVKSSQTALRNSEVGGGDEQKSDELYRGQSSSSKIVAHLDAENSVPRKALLIGNSRYHSLPVLKGADTDINEVNDALISSAGFRHASHGFTHVYRDVTFREFWQELRKFYRLLCRGDDALVYYCGHGFWREGDTYLVAVDAPAITSMCIDSFLEKFCVSLKSITLDVCNKEPRLKIFCIDACQTRAECCWTCGECEKSKCKAHGKVICDCQMDQEKMNQENPKSPEPSKDTAKEPITRNEQKEPETALKTVENELGTQILDPNPSRHTVPSRDELPEFNTFGEYIGKDQVSDRGLRCMARDGIGSMEELNRSELRINLFTLKATVPETTAEETSWGGGSFTNAFLKSIKEEGVTLANLRAAIQDHLKRQGRSDGKGIQIPDCTSNVCRELLGWKFV